MLNLSFFVPLITSLPSFFQTRLKHLFHSVIISMDATEYTSFRLTFRFFE